MKFLYFFLILLLVRCAIYAQTIDVSGECITATITLNRVADVNGKAAYQGTGTVNGIADVTVNIYWLTPDNLWIIDFDGQPYFQNACNTIRPPATGIAACPWSTVTGTTCDGASNLVVSGLDVVPVRLISFTATIINNTVRLNWKTASETNNKGFAVQRSSDGIIWKEFGFVSGAINSFNEKSYQFTDGDPLNGKNFYRLVQFDLDDRQSYSQIVKLDFVAGDFYSLNNNAGNGLYQLTIRSEVPVEISVLDLSGRKLSGKIAGRGVHQLNLRQYAKGMYLLYLKRENVFVIEKLIKQ